MDPYLFKRLWRRPWLSLCGLVVLFIGAGMLVDRLKHRKYLEKGDDNIIDAL